MAITLDGLTLPNLVKEDEFGKSKVRSIVNETLGGTPIIWESARTIKPFDLIGGNDWGWISRTTLISLRTKADVVGATYTLVYEAETITVRFRNEEGNAIEATPLVARPNHDDTDWYNNVVLKLMTW